jgi:hypothetical protein
MSIGIVYYTDNRLDDTPIGRAVQVQLQRCAQRRALEIISVSLRPIEFGINVVLPERRGILTMFKQILAGLEASTADTVYLCEHDVLYHPSHFEFALPRRDVYYYNDHQWRVRASDGRALFYHCKQLSALCADRQLLIGHYRRRIAKVEQNARDLHTLGKPVRRDGFSQHMGFEPGCHAVPRGVDNYPARVWCSVYPNLDIRHDRNLTPNRWTPEEFRDPQSCLGWTWADSIAGWGQLRGRFDQFLAEVECGRYH